MNANEKAYKAVAQVANPTKAEGLKKPRGILLLWFLRNVLGIDDLEAYEYICDGDNDQGFDGLVLEEPEGTEGMATLTVLQSKYPEKAKNEGINELKTFVGTALPFDSLEAFDILRQEKLEVELEALLTRFRVRDRLAARRLRIRLIFVTAGAMTSQAQSYVKGLNKTRKDTYLTVYDATRLAPIVQAFSAPSTVAATLDVSCDNTQRFVTTVGGGRVAICSVKVQEIVSWPGIQDRTLFDLNVRRELKFNPVRRALDRAIQKTADHPNFLAFHNGLTVVCEKIDDSSLKKLSITNLSVVNGAQSTVAFYEHQAHLSADLRIVVKFVETPSDQQLAREVAIRSNTQNPVTNRNLRARDGIQLRLVNEFKSEYPKITFEVRPDYSNPPVGAVIQNDVAAQYMCALYNEQPWLAVKRLTLFDSETYPTIFHKDISASHVVLADRVADRVEAARSELPELYTGSWQLTKLVTIYLAGQILRTEPKLAKMLIEPAAALADSNVDSELDEAVKFAVSALKLRHDKKNTKTEFDDYKVDFKREGALKELATQARDYSLMYKTMNKPKVPASGKKPKSKDGK